MVSRRSLHVFVALAVLAAGCARDPETLKRRHMERGTDYFARRQYPEAVIEFANAVRIDPRFGEGRLRLGDAYVAAGNVKAAVPEFLRAADLLKDNPEAQLKAANVLIRGGLFAEGRNRLRPVLQKDPKNATALLLLGNALAGLKNMDDAVGVVDRLIEVDPERGGVYTNRGVFSLAKGDPVEAEAAFAKAVSVSGRAPDALVGLGNFYRAVRRFPDAERVLREAVSRDPKHVGANDALASLYVESGRPGEAEPHLKAIVAVTGLAAAQYALASYYVAVERVPAAIEVLTALTKTKTEYVRATTRLALLEFFNGNRAAAKQRIDEALKRDKNDGDVLTTKARLLLADGRITEALPYAKAALLANAELAPAHLTLARALIASGRLEEARRALNDTLRLDANSLPALLELTNLHLQRREMDSAVQFASQAATTHKESLTAQLTLVRILSRRDADQPRAEREITSLLRQYPKSAAVHNALAALFLAEGKRDLAAKAFEFALTLDPNSYDATLGLVSIDVGAGRGAAARGRIDTMLAQHPTETAPLLLAAAVFTETGETGRVEAMLKHALLSDSSNPAAYTMLAQLYVQQRRIPEAMKSFEEVARLQPESVAPPTMLGLLAFIQHDEPQAQRWWQRALEIDPTAAAAANNLAWLYAQQGKNLEVALQLAQTARGKFPDLPEVNDTLGWVYLRKGLSGTSIDYFAQSVEAEPKNPIYHFHLGLAYAEQGEDGKARKALDRALALDPKFEGAPEARKTLQALVF